MNRNHWTLIALLLIPGILSARPEFERDRVTVEAQSWQYTQVLTYNYTTMNSNLSDVDSGTRTANRDLQEDGWIGFFLYDYTAARYTEELLVGHDRL